MWRFWRASGSSKDKALAEAIKKRLGYTPRRIDLYKSALTHGSTLRNSEKLNCSERLEFLGDAVIEMVVSHYLYARFGAEREGFLTQMRSRLVSRQHLSELALKLNLQSLLSTYNVRVTKNILGNAFEALVGAMFLDVGYERTARAFTKAILETLTDVSRLQYKVVDFKSQLIEIIQRKRWRIAFDLASERTAAQTMTFHCTLRINEQPCGSGSGRSKKEAQQNASKEALEWVRRQNNQA